MSELKPCPFCGEKASENSLTQITKYDLYTVSCENRNCGVHPYTVGLTSGEAVKKWNKRSNGWIPVTERLPEKYGRVLATYVEYGVEKVGQVTFGDMRQSCEPYELVSGFTLFSKYCEEEVIVIAWQPLPEPYEEDKSNV